MFASSAIFRKNASFETFRYFNVQFGQLKFSIGNTDNNSANLSSRHAVLTRLFWHDNGLSTKLSIQLDSELDSVMNTQAQC